MDYKLYEQKIPSAEEIRRYSSFFEGDFLFDPDGTKKRQTDLEVGHIEDSTYVGIRNGSIRGAIENFISYPNEKGEQGILLIHRNNLPMKNHLWCVGGKQERGYSPRDSLRINAKRECNLELSDFVFLGCFNALFGSSSDKRLNGLHDFAAVYYSQGEGELKFQKLDDNPLIVTPEMWYNKKEELKDLHPHISNMLERAMILVQDKFY